MLNLRAIPLAATLAVGGAVLAATPLASAKGGDGVLVAGVCGKSSTSKLKVKHEDSGIEVEFEVDQNRNGVPWKVVVRRNGALVVSRTTVTRGRSGSFSLERVISGGGGTFVAVATRSGERCSATASI